MKTIEEFLDATRESAERHGNTVRLMPGQDDNIHVLEITHPAIGVTHEEIWCQQDGTVRFVERDFGTVAEFSSLQELADYLNEALG